MKKLIPEGYWATFPFERWLRQGKHIGATCTPDEISKSVYATFGSRINAMSLASSFIVDLLKSSCNITSLLIRKNLWTGLLVHSNFPSSSSIHSGFVARLWSPMTTSAISPSVSVKQCAADTTYLRLISVPPQS